MPASKSVRKSNRKWPPVWAGIFRLWIGLLGLYRVMQSQQFESYRTVDASRTTAAENSSWRSSVPRNRTRVAGTAAPRPSTGSCWPWRITGLVIASDARSSLEQARTLVGEAYPMQPPGMKWFYMAPTDVLEVELLRREAEALIEGKVKEKQSREN